MGINIYNRKEDNLVRCKQNIHNKLNTIYSYPVYAYFEVSNACNLRCMMCGPQVYDLRFKQSGYKGVMPLEVIKRIEHILPYMHSCSLMGNGEPLLNKDFLQIARIMREKQIAVSFNTNGTLLNEHYARELIKLGVGCIIISIDGATRETFEKIREGAEFDKIISNIKGLSKLKGGIGKTPKIGISCVSMAINIHETTDIVHMASSIGAESVHFEPLFQQNTFGYKEMYENQNLSNVPRQQIREYFNKAKECGEKYGILITSPFYNTELSNYDYFQEDRIVEDQELPFCTLPWTTIFLNRNGDVRTCCGSAKIFGNVLREDIQKIWNNQKYRDYRNAIINKKIPIECKMCVKNKREENLIPIIEAQLQSYNVARQKDIEREGGLHGSNMSAHIKDLENHIGNLETTVRSKDAVLNQIYNSNSWIVLSFYFRVRNKLFPVNSKRRDFARLLVNLLKSTKRIFY